MRSSEQTYNVEDDISKALSDAKDYSDDARREIDDWLDRFWGMKCVSNSQCAESLSSIFNIYKTFSCLPFISVWVIQISTKSILDSVVNCQRTVCWIITTRWSWPRSWPSWSSVFFSRLPTFSRVHKVATVLLMPCLLNYIVCFHTFFRLTTNKRMCSYIFPLLNLYPQYGKTHSGWELID